MHTGIDYYPESENPCNTSVTVSCPGDIIRASGGGKICYKGWYNGLGNTIIIEHLITNGSNGNDGTMIYTLYAHLCSFGQKENGEEIHQDWVVNKGDKIGTMGNTGGNWNSHLHFEVKDACVAGTPLECSGCALAYTPNHPDTYGYHNPVNTIAYANNFNPPKLTSPISTYESTIPFDDINFDWEDVEGATSYRIQVFRVDNLLNENEASCDYGNWSPNCGFTQSTGPVGDVVVNQVVNTSNFTWSENIENNKYYYWTVRAGNSSIGSYYSGWKKFYVSGSASIISPNSIENWEFGNTESVIFFTPYNLDNAEIQLSTNSGQSYDYTLSNIQPITAYFFHVISVEVNNEDWISTNSRIRIITTDNIGDLKPSNTNSNKNNFNYSVVVESDLFAVLPDYSPPDNNICSGASELPVYNFCLNELYTTTDATNSYELPSPNCSNYYGDDIWFKVTVPNSGSLLIETFQQSSFSDSGLEAYTGSCGNLNSISCNDDYGEMGHLSLTNLSPGQEVYLRFWVTQLSSLNNPLYGQFNICAYSPPNVNASIEMTYPSNGTTWLSGQPYNIYWNSNNLPNDVTISLGLFKSGNLVEFIANGETDNGQFNFNLPYGIASGNDYHIRGYAYQNGSIISEDDTEVFTINTGPPPGYIDMSLTATNYVRGQNQAVEWEDNIVEYIKIQLFNTNGSLITTIDSSDPSDGYYFWSVPTSISTGNYILRITSINNPSLYDEKYISILNPTTNYPPQVSITSHSNGQIVTTDEINLTGTAFDDVDTYQTQVANNSGNFYSATMNSNDTWYKNGVDLDPGWNTIQINHYGLEIHSLRND